MIRKTLTALATFALLAPGTVLAREAHAILIGASTYPALDQRFWLKGPANDVDLVANYLQSNPALPFAASNIVKLADGLAGSQAPTLAAIRAEFAAMTTRVEDGDFVYLHFSGHGSQTPAADPSSELDGLDEIFLPVDIGPWEDSIGKVQNALVDDEIGQMIDALRAKGADVWVVFDSCHSGTATRAAPGTQEVALRQLPPGGLGIPTALLDDIESTSRALPDPRSQADAPMPVTAGNQGRLTAFFAAQTNETTPEKNMPKGKADRRLQGVFTYTLFETMAERPGISYRQLAQEVLRKYGTRNLARTTPLFEGDLDLPVFGHDQSDRILQWQAQVSGDQLAIKAGQLHGLEPGISLSLMASPADPDDAALATFSVTEVTTFTAKATSVDFFVEDLPPGAVLRRVGEVLDLSLTIALPAPGSAPAMAMDAALQVIREAELTGARIRFAPVGDPGADLRLTVLADSPRPDALWFLPAAGVTDESTLIDTPSISTADKSATELAEIMAGNLRKMSRALNLMRVGAASSAASAVKVEAQMVRGRFDAATDSVAPDSRVMLANAIVPKVLPDDTIGLHLKNTTDKPVDFNILYVGSDYSISFMDNGRMMPGDTLDQDYILITGDSFGRERVIVVFSPATTQSEVEDLSFLEQSAVERTRAAGPTPKGLKGLLDEAGFGTTTRAAMSLSRRKKDPDPVPLFVQFDLDTLRPE